MTTGFPPAYGKPVQPPAPAAATAGPAPAAPVHRTRVLVVDDNCDAAETLSALLDLLGHDAQVANDGPAALAAMQDFRPQLVFLDLGMPGMNGCQVAEAIRRDRRFDQPVLVALTGWGSEGDRERTSAAGFDLHLTKPISLEAIEQMLATV
jgi:CheY-like chemotaxis protein